MHEFREAATRLRQRVQTEYRPLQARHNAVRADLVRVLDHAHDTYKLTKGERAKIASLLLDGCYDLPQKGHPEIQAILDKYEAPETTAEAAAADAETAELMKEMFSRQFGIEFEADADVSTPEKFQAYLHQKMAAQQAAYEQQEAERAAPPVGKPLSSRPPKKKSWPRSRTLPRPCAPSTATWLKCCTPTWSPTRPKSCAKPS